MSLPPEEKQGYADALYSKRRDQVLLEFMPIFAVIAALCVGAFLLLMSHVNPLFAYAIIAAGAFGTPQRISSTLLVFTPLLLGSLGIGIAFRTNCFNLGGQGQAWMGYLTAGTVAIAFINFVAVSPIAIVYAMLTAFLAGGLVAFVPAILKTELNINEVVVTIIMNYITFYVSVFLLDYFISTPLLPTVILLPSIFYRLSIGFFLGLAVVPVIWLIVNRLAIGYKMQVTGYSIRTAKCSGIDTRKVIWLAMFLSGGLMGLGGGIDLLGNYHRVYTDYAASIGFTAVTVAMLGNLDPLGTLVAALFISALRQGGLYLQIVFDVPPNLIDVIEATILLFLLVGRYVIKKAGTPVLPKVYLFQAQRRPLHTCLGGFFVGIVLEFALELFFHEI
ncbi:MAG: ABC transporter permease [Candidatus Ranarchaeia archaeon]